MSKQDNEQQKAAEEMLQKLQAVYMNGNQQSSEPSTAAEEPAAKTSAPKEKAARPAPEEKPRTASKKQPEAVSVPSSKVPEPKKEEPSKAKTGSGDSRGTTLPRSSSNPYLIKPEEPALESKPSSDEQKPEEKKKTTRPNAVKIPPRKRSGINTGAIKPKNAPAQTSATEQPSKAEQEKPKQASPAGTTRYGGTTLPRKPSVIVISPKESEQEKPKETVQPSPKPEPSKAQPKPAVSDKPEQTKATTQVSGQRETVSKVTVTKATTVSSASAAMQDAKPAARAEAIFAESPSPKRKEESPAEKPVPKEPVPAAERSQQVPHPITRVVDIDGRPTVEPIENTEAAETVSEPTPKKKTPWARGKGKKQKKAESEEGLDATAIIAKRTGLDESDIALIFELGYENELGRLVGYETLKKLKYEHLRSSPTETGDYYSQSFGYRGKEYTSATPREQVLSAYVHDRRTLILRVVLMFFLTIAAFVTDFPHILGPFLSTYSEKLPFLFSAAGFVLLIVATILCRRRIWAGWRAFLRFSPSPYSAIAVCVPLMLLYSLASLIDAKTGTLTPMNFATILSLLVLSFCDIVRIADEIRTFRVISEQGDKCILEESEPRKKKVRQGSRTVKILNDEAGEHLYRVRQTHEIVGFFRRVNDLSAASTPFTRFTVALLSCAAVAGVASSLIFDSPLKGILVAASTLMFSVPVSATWLFFDPLRRANKHLVSRRSVLVGEGSVNEYSTHKTIIFNDTETFRAKCQSIILQEKDDARRDERLAGMLFQKLGGTLSTTESVKLADGKEEDVKLIRLTETGVEALVENRYRLLAGDALFMTHSGVEIPKESGNRISGRSRGVSVLYVAVNGSLRLTYEIAYTMSNSFRDIIALLAQADTTLAVQSYDPNLNDAFLHVGFADGDEVVRVIKPAQFERPIPAEVTDTGAVTLDGPLGTAYPLRASSLIVQTRRSGFRALLTSIFPGTLLAFFAVHSLPAKLLPFLPLFAVGYRAVWFLVSWILSATSLSRKAIFDDTGENLANEDFNS